MARKYDAKNASTSGILFTRLLMLFILTDPPTSPTKYREQLVCGVLVAAVSFVLFRKTGVVYYLLTGVVAADGALFRNPHFKTACRRIPHRRMP